ncbi:MFS transporter [Larkinella terrae]|uniref:MFS transporter n=1 Tax=Larkinella terrae TaxID=2025311 RepID=A0A7K0EHE7_9BACT|nr:MFS transporter [Larkinella terrae]MRS61011.1 MFS transporter [Larkinella terrae]
MIGRSLRLYRDAYRGLPVPVWLLGGVMLINRSGTMVLPYLTLYLTQHLHYSVTEAGLVMTVYGAGALFGTFLGGRLSDQFGFYPVQFFSLLISGFFLIFLQFAHHFYTMCGVVFVYTLLGDAFRPAVSSAIAYYSVPENRTRAYSLNRLAINLGWSLGGGLGGYLASIDYRLLFWVDGLTCILAAGVLRAYLPVPDRSVAATPETGLPTEGSSSAYRDSLFLIFVGATVLFAIGFWQLFSMAPLYFKQILHLKETEIGLLMTMNGLMIVFTEMALVFAVEKRYARQKGTIIGFGALLVGLSYLLLNAGIWPFLAVISVFINTFGEMLSMPFMQSFTVERATAQNRGQYLALYSMAYAVAQITAPAIGSQVVAWAGFPMLWVVVMGLCLVSASLFWWIARQVKKTALVGSVL